MLIDIGANIGDTAAIMATYSNSPLVLIEPSEIYGQFLRKNIARLPNQTTVHAVMISANKTEQGILVHAGGTARFETVDGAGTQMECKSLADVSAERPSMIKIDTDGFDLPILEANLDFLARFQPCLFYENEVKDGRSREAADRVITSLHDIGYRHFALFDDSGLHIISTTEPAILYSLNAYLYKVRSSPVERDLYNYDVLCATQNDKDVFTAVDDYYRRN
jgi:FkbM family methyltransferase